MPTLCQWLLGGFLASGDKKEASPSFYEINNNTDNSLVTPVIQLVL
jgi:hypothetical protein